MERFGLYAPVFEIPPLHCARYAVMAAKELSGAKYQNSNAWQLAKKNILIKKIEDSENLEYFVELLEPRKSIIIFYNPESRYNNSFRIGTHAAAYIGNKKEPIFAEQYKDIQRISTLSEMKKLRLKPVQIIHPRIYKE